jgi:hypothetical protein
LIASRKGGARHVQHLAQFALIELGARREPVFDQHLAQSACHLFVQRGTWDGDDFCSHAGILYAKNTAVKSKIMVFSVDK